MDLKEVTHSCRSHASADTVFARLRDVSAWPNLFPPTIHAEVLEQGDRVEKIRIWAVANGEPKSWVSVRQIDPEKRTIQFEQARTAAPVGRMIGRWEVRETDDGGSEVELYHGYYPREDTPEQWAVIDTAVDRNSNSELAALKAAVESADTDAERFTFSDTVRSAGSAERAFEFLDRGDLWSQRLGHVPEVTMESFVDGMQRLRMTTRTSDGSEHVTESFRVSIPQDGVLAYKQTTLPPLLGLHTGVWTVTQSQDNTLLITSEHTVSINVDKVEALLGLGATAEDARELARRNLSNNSQLTLARTAEFAEGR